MKKLSLYSKLLLPTTATLCAFGFARPSEGSILRSAALYYTPSGIIETTALATYQSENLHSGFTETQMGYSTTGARLEHGMNSFLSWGGQFQYATGTKEIKTSLAPQSETIQGFYDPQVFLKAHYQTENFRFHGNTLLKIKSDSLVLSYDRTPFNFSEGASSLALQLGSEFAAGPTILGMDLYGDLWRDTQEVILRQPLTADTLYFREGGRALSLRVFGELTSFKSIKPGLSLKATQISERETSLQDNQFRTSNSLLRFTTPQEQQYTLSVYGRVKLPSTFVLNFEIYGTKIEQASTLNSPVNTPINAPINSSSTQNMFNIVGVSTNIGFKF